MKPGKKGVERMLDATRYSWRGFVAAYQHEAAFRQELAGCCIGIPLAVVVARDETQFLLLALPLLLLLLAELANSAIESTVDRIGPDFHDLAGRAKNMGSAVVFMALLIVALSWGTILGGNYVW